MKGDGLCLFYAMFFDILINGLPFMNPKSRFFKEFKGVKSAIGLKNLLMNIIEMYPDVILDYNGQSIEANIMISSSLTVAEYVAIMRAPMLSSANYGSAIEIALFQQITAEEIPVAYFRKDLNELSFGTSIFKCANEIKGIHGRKTILVFEKDHYDILLDTSRIMASQSVMERVHFKEEVVISEMHLRSQKPSQKPDSNSQVIDFF
jgi:hypothetical protein